MMEITLWVSPLILGPRYGGQSLLTPAWPVAFFPRPEAF
jgi:hypothetical protein